MTARNSSRARHRPDRHVRGDGPPEPPADLDPADLPAWHHMVGLLAPYGVLWQVDGMALARYVRVYRRWKECGDWIKRYGMTMPVKNEAGEVVGVVEYPQVARELSLSDHLLRLEREYGLTPASRAKLNIDFLDVDAKAKKAFGREEAQPPVQIVADNVP